MSPVSRLDYAAAAEQRRRLLNRRIRIVVAVVAVGLAFYWSGPVAWRKYSDAARFRRLASWSPPPDALVYVRDPSAAALTHGLPTTCATALGEVAVHEVPDERNRRFITASLPFATVFVRGFSGPDGPQLLIVELAAQPLTTHPPRPGVFEFLWTIQSRDGSRFRSSSRHVFLVPPDELATSRNVPVCFFAGQRDLVDETHFTIRYEYGGAPGIIDGWLLDDDTVKLQVREVPAGAPAR